jgi:stearoyl-CoA desaturase (delta-9 desaturase)
MKLAWNHVDWLNSSFLLLAHLLALTGVVLYVFVLKWSWWTFGLALVWMWLSSVSVTGGYHRLFAHRTYRCHPIIKALYLFFGAAAVQNSALNWSSDHRRHHGETDKEGDPYNIKKGFWWAHVGWVLFQDPSRDQRNVPDLAEDPLIRFQHRYYVPLAFVFGLFLPLGISMLWGDAIGAFFLVCWIRLVLQYQATFSVNSFAHYIGHQPYSDADSSRDSFITAMITLGEGYHNFHHAFPGDYRNGVRAYHFDPTKWWVNALSWLRLTWDLRVVPQHNILRARLRMDARALRDKVYARAQAMWWEERIQAAREQWEERIQAARERIEKLHERWLEMKRRYSEMKARLGRQARAELLRLKAEMRVARAEFKAAYREWCECLRRPERLLVAG